MATWRTLPGHQARRVAGVHRDAWTAAGPESLISALTARPFTRLDACGPGSAVPDQLASRASRCRDCRECAEVAETLQRT
jgi:hypothetical protein